MDAKQKREDRAMFLAAGADRWLKCRDKAGRPLAYGVPSSSVPGLFHLADTRTCDCKSFQYRGDCPHRMAVELHVARVRAARQERAAA